jgi:uncharacterized protein
MEEPQLSPDLRRILLEVAAKSVRHGLEAHSQLKVDLNSFAPELREMRATFVTLYLREELQGCIGTLRPVHPLVEDVVHNAYSAAYEDPRALRLTLGDLEHIHVHISLLNAPQPIEAKTEDDLVAQLRVGIDGLIIEDNGRRGTFLPAVWESLPDPRDFVRHVKLKAGLPMNHWSETIKFSRYTTETFSS